MSSDDGRTDSGRAGLHAGFNATLRFGSLTYVGAAVSVLVFARLAAKR